MHEISFLPVILIYITRAQFSISSIKINIQTKIFVEIFLRSLRN